jgi:dTDP-4-dehydrorhamnose reductase
MKVLLLGKDGQVGGALRVKLPALGEVVALGRAGANFEKPQGLASLVEEQRPDVIINAAAYTAVDKAETDHARAKLVNTEAVAVLAAAARRHGAWLVHYSTDYVYDGEKPGPYVETDFARPLSVYGASKLAGDFAIAESGCQHLVFRVSWVYAAGHANFAASMLRLAGARETLNVVSDQIGAPTSAGLIAATTIAALRQVLGAGEEGESLSGLYHLAAAGTVSRVEYARFVIATALQQGAKLKLGPANIAAVLTSAYPLPAGRPLNSQLDTSKLRNAFNLHLPPWQDDAATWVTDTLEKVPT